MRHAAELLTLFFLCLIGTQADAGKGLPTIVFFIADDHGAGDCTPYGGHDVPTPNMQRLANEGLRFDRAYVASPSCGPSRACLLSGLMPARNGAIYNHQEPHETTASLVPLLQAAGYEVMGVGKVAHGRQGPERWGVPMLPGKVKTEFPTETLRGFLAERDPQRPLCLFVGSTAAHVPWPEDSAIANDAVTLPPEHYDTPAMRQQRNHYLKSVEVTDRHLGETLRLADRFLGENRLTIYTSDHGVQLPFAKWNLYEAGIRSPLLVTWPGVVEPGTTTAAMVSWIDLLPTLLEIADGETPAGIDGRSFAAVLRGESTTCRREVFALQNGDGARSQYPMRSLRGNRFKYIRNLRSGWAFTTHIDQVSGRAGEAYFSSWLAAAESDPRAGAVVKRYYQRPPEELFDLSVDPHELENLAKDPKYAEQLSAMRQQVDSWMASQGDDGLIDTGRRVRLLSNPADYAPDWSPLSNNPPFKGNRKLKKKGQPARG